MKSFRIGFRSLAVPRVLFATVFLVGVAISSEIKAVDSSRPGTVGWSLQLGGGSASGNSQGLSFQAGCGFQAGLGYHLSLGLAPSYSGFLQSMPNDASYFIDMPIALTGYFEANESVRMAVTGGIGIGFSDLPSWSQSNRALTGHVGVALNLNEGQSSDLWLEARMVKASTSTANVTFGFLCLRYVVGM